MRGELYKIAAYLDKEELKLFMAQVSARGVGQSGFIREMLGFEVRPRGAPKGQRKKCKTEKFVSSTKASRVSKSKQVKKAPEGKAQLSFLD